MNQDFHCFVKACDCEVKEVEEDGPINAHDPDVYAHISCTYVVPIPFSLVHLCAVPSPFFV